MNGLKEIAALLPGPSRTAAIAAWIQGLFLERIPVLVGGAAVELYTGGSYTTGDFDFVGQVPSRVARVLEKEGFRKEGRHWIHEDFEIFVEFPGSAVAPGERTAVLEIDGIRILTLSPEDLIVDRLAAWKFWRSETDGISAYLIWRAQERRLDHERLVSVALRGDVSDELEALRELASRGRSISEGELEQWARRRS